MGSENEPGHQSQLGALAVKAAPIARPSMMLWNPLAGLAKQFSAWWLAETTLARRLSHVPGPKVQERPARVVYAIREKASGLSAGARYRLSIW